MNRKKSSLINLYETPE